MSSYGFLYAFITIQAVRRLCTDADRRVATGANLIFSVGETC